MSADDIRFENQTTGAEWEASLSTGYGVLGDDSSGVHELKSRFGKHGKVIRALEGARDAPLFYISMPYRLIFV